MVDFNKLRKQNEEKALMKKNKKKSGSLKDRLNKSYESKDKGGGGRPSAMDWKKVENVKFYKPKEGSNRIDIIPYKTKTKNDPLVASGDCKIGEESYMLDLFIHNSIGPTQSDVICLKEKLYFKDIIEMTKSLRVQAQQARQEKIKEDRILADEYRSSIKDIQSLLTQIQEKMSQPPPDPKPECKETTKPLETIPEEPKLLRTQSGRMFKSMRGFYL